jgi:uncharacterized protein (DUF736 family)
MANALGYVTETRTGFEGALAMMNLSSPIRIEKNAEKAAEGQPDYRIFAGDTATEIGGGWLRKAKGSGRDYISITLADPQIMAKQCCSWGHLVWASRISLSPLDAK